MSKPWLGKHLPEETKRKMSEAHKGKKPYEMTDGVREKISKALKGRKLFKKTREKISRNLKGKYRGKNNWHYGKHHSEEIKRKMSITRKKIKLTDKWKKKISEAKKGKKLSEEHKKKVSEALKRQWAEGKRKAKTGYRHTEKWKERMRGRIPWNKGKKCPQMSMERNGSWRGGISYEPYSTDWTETLRRSIRERDHYICQLCKKQQGEKAFAVHHIDYNKKNNNPDNLITLCESCHGKTNFNRDYWTNYFLKLWT